MVRVAHVMTETGDGAATMEGASRLSDGGCPVNSDLLLTAVPVGLANLGAIVAAWWAIRREIRHEIGDLREAVRAGRGRARQERLELRREIGGLRSEVMGIRERVARIEAKLGIPA